MNLLVDAGNSQLKWAWLHHSHLADHGSLQHSRADQLAAQWEALPTPSRVVCASVAGPAVRERIEQLVTRLWGIRAEFVQTSAESLGLVNAYPEAVSLGVDRWMAMLAAWEEFQRRVAVIDCGTAVTVDVIDDGGRHLGGQIAPGQRLMMESLAQQTHALPKTSGSATGLANTTNAAIAAGCQQALCAYVGSMVTHLRDTYGVSMPVLLTGGEASLILDRLKEPVSLRPHLVLEGIAITVEQKK